MFCLGVSVWLGVCMGVHVCLSQHIRWWTYSIVRCRTEWCWLAGTWWETSAARTATASWAGSMSLPQRTASGTRRVASSWRGRWSGRARASKSTSPLTTREPSYNSWITHSCALCTVFPIPLPLCCIPPSADLVVSNILAPPPSRTYDLWALLFGRLIGWIYWFCVGFSKIFPELSSTGHSQTARHIDKGPGYTC